MIEYNTDIQIPRSAYVYSLTKLLLFLSLPSLLFSSLDSASSFFSYLFMMFVFLGFPIYLSVILSYKYVSFVVSDSNIVTKSGILTKKTKIIPLSSIQNIVTHTGPLMSLFGLTIVEIWDASNNNNEDKEIATGNVLLKKLDVERFKSLILISKQPIIQAQAEQPANLS